MNKQQEWVFFILLLQVCFIKYVNSDSSAVAQQNIHIQRYQGFRLVSFHQELEVRSVVDCGMRCGSDSQCAAANFNAVSRKCQLSSDTFGTGSKEEASEWEVLDRQIWKTFGGSEYLLVDSPNSWAAAKDICESYHAYLTDITSEAENDFITQLIGANTPDEYCWVGGNDQDHDGAWTWLSGSLIGSPFRNWNNGEPNGLGIEFCLFVRQGYWYDGPCDWAAKSVCKRP